jgi:hypothetical protein
MNNVNLPQKNKVKYLGMPLETRLTWAKYMKSERKELNLKTNELAAWKITSVNRKQTPLQQYVTQNGSLESSYGGQPPTPTSKCSSAFNPRLSNLF